VLAAAVADGGTNLLGLTPPDTIVPAFGPGSFARHRAALLAAGVQPVVVQDEGIGRDIDRPGDLAAFRWAGAGTRTQAFLTAIRIGDRLPAAARTELAEAGP
jgi:2-phospho-L-lactate guanylyltransferase